MRPTPPQASHGVSHRRQAREKGEDDEHDEHRTDRPGKEGRKVPVRQRQPASKILVEQVTENDPQHQRGHRIAHPPQQEPKYPERKHHVDVEHPLRDGIGPDHAKNEHHRISRSLGNAQNEEERAGKQQAEDGHSNGREEEHRNHEINKVRLLDHDHRPRPHAVDKEGRDENRRRRRARNRKGQRRNKRARDHGAVAGFRRGQPSTDPLPKSSRSFEERRAAA